MAQLTPAMVGISTCIHVQLGASPHVIIKMRHSLAVSPHSHIHLYERASITLSPWPDIVLSPLSADYLSGASLTFVFGLSRLRLNTPPSVLYLSWMPSSLCCEASCSMAAITMLKRVGTRTQPSFTPFVAGKDSEMSPPSITVALMPSFEWRTSDLNFLGQSNVSIICHSPSLQAVSNALVKSINVMKRSSYWYWHFSCSWRATKITSTVPRPLRKPHWLSVSRPCSKSTIRQLGGTHANIVPAMARREIPL